MNGRTYTDIDITTSSDVIGRLAEREAAGPTIIIMSEDNPNGRFLTRQMDEIVNKLTPLRIRSIADIHAKFPRQQPGEGWMLLEAELSHIDAAKCASLRTANTLFFSNNKVAALVESIKSISERLKRFQQETNQNEPALDMSYNFYRGSFLLLIAIDFFINLESFRSIPGWPPIGAIFVTLAVAAVMVSAGHIHGQILKQFKDTFSERLDNRAREYIVLGLITIAVLFAFGAVLYARQQLFAAVVQRESLLRGVGGWGSWVSTVLPSIAYNVMVYLAGVVFSFRAHHERRGFDTVFRQYSRRMRRFRALHRRKLYPLLRRVHAEATESEARVKQRHMALLGTPAYQQARDMVTAILSKDAELVELLNNYKTALGYAIRNDNSAARLEIEDLTGLSITRRTVMSIDQYLAMPVRLPL